MVYNMKCVQVFENDRMCMFVCLKFTSTLKYALKGHCDEKRPCEYGDIFSERCPILSILRSILRYPLKTGLTVCVFCLFMF